MITFEKIGFRPIEFADLECLRLIHNDASTLLNLGNAELVTVEEQENWWKGLANSKTAKRFSIVELSTCRVIGLIRVQNIDQVNRNCEVGLDIARDMRGQGFGHMAYRALLGYLFDQYNMHMVYLRYIATNNTAANLYRSLGFQDSGALKEFIFRDGNYMDYKIMCLTNQEYKARAR